MKLDILVLAAHPDDAELSCSGTIIDQVQKGKKVGIVDFTRGELGTRGTPETREMEAKKASEIMGLAARENLEFEDGFFQNDREHLLKVIEAIRRYQPDIVFANALQDRHIDHGKAAKVAHDACFLSGLVKIVTYSIEGKMELPWRPKAIFHYIQDYYMKPDLVVDITPHWEQRTAAIQAYKTQFHNPNYESNEPETPISSPQFVNFLEGRAREMGRLIGAEFGEGFIKATPIKVTDFSHFI